MRSRRVEQRAPSERALSERAAAPSEPEVLGSRRLADTLRAQSRILRAFSMWEPQARLHRAPLEISILRPSLKITRKGCENHQNSRFFVLSAHGKKMRCGSPGGSGASHLASASTAPGRDSHPHPRGAERPASASGRSPDDDLVGPCSGGSLADARQAAASSPRRDARFALPRTTSS